MKVNVVILTKEEPQAFRLIGRVCELIDPGDAVIVWDDYSNPEWLAILDFYRQVYRFSFYQHSLNSDFSAHRNAVKDKVPHGEWIVMLDADEWILPGFFVRLKREIASRPGVDGLFVSRFSTWYPTDTLFEITEPDWPKLVSSDSYPDWQPRVFRNLPHMRFVRPVNEWFENFANAPRIQGKDITILHHKPKDWKNRYWHLVHK